MFVLGVHTASSETKVDNLNVWIYLDVSVLFCTFNNSNSRHDVILLWTMINSNYMEGKKYHG